MINFDNIDITVITTLQKKDVYRFLKMANSYGTLDQARALIHLHREDLITECNEVLEELCEEQSLGFYQSFKVAVK